VDDGSLGAAAEETSLVYTPNKQRDIIRIDFWSDLV
jgi:hypothetical protein